jgi:glycosidase
MVSLRFIQDSFRGEQMQTSIWGNDVQAVLDQARVPGFKWVQVGSQLVEITVPFPSPEDWRDTLMYFLLVDRFNNPQAAPKNPPWDGEYSDFQGGTFNGIREQLDYLRALGIGAIWLSPVLKNCQYSPTYHGYGIQDFLSIDPRFASDPAQAENELRQLVDEAHARGIYIIFDIVLHHTGDVFAYQDYGSLAPWNGQPYTITWRDEHGNARPDWTEAPANPPPNAAVWPQELRSNAYFRRQGNAFGPSDQLIDASGDFYSLKGIASDVEDSSGYPVRHILTRAYQYLIAKYDIDGFRIDTLKYISSDFARNFANNIREFALSIGKKNFFTFGEVYDSERTISNFIGRNTLHSEEGDPIGVDAALDYPLFYNLPGTCKGILAPATVANLYEVRKQVESDILSTHGDASNFFVTFLDNHDQLTRYYYRDASNPDRFDDQVTLGVSCLFALPGIPCLYYGTEQGLSGGGGAVEAVREAFWGKPDAFDRNSVFYQAIAKLAALRNASPVLRYGRYYFRPLSGDGTHFGISTTAPGVLAFSRILDDQEALVVANADTRAGWTGEVIIDFSLNQTGAAYRILFSNKTQPVTPGAVEEKVTGSIEVMDVDGNTTHGPVRVLGVHLQPMEIQILAKAPFTELHQ